MMLLISLVMAVLSVICLVLRLGWVWEVRV